MTRTNTLMIATLGAALLATACASKPVAGGAQAPRIAIAVTQRGFEPAHIIVHQGQLTTLVFHRDTDRTCAREIVVAVGNGRTVRSELPLGQDVPVTATFGASGELRYACGMDMVSGVISVQ